MSMSTTMKRIASISCRWTNYMAVKSPLEEKP
jgi:hypothetical protein